METTVARDLQVAVIDPVDGHKVSDHMHPRGSTNETCVYLKLLAKDITTWCAANQDAQILSVNFVHLADRDPGAIILYK